MRTLTYTQLAQLRENTTTATDIYNCQAGQTVQAFLKISNVSSSAAEVRVFHDNSGSTFDESTAIVWDMRLLPGEILEIDHIFINDENGYLGYRTSVANALNATLYGIVR